MPDRDALPTDPNARKAWVERCDDCTVAQGLNLAPPGERLEVLERLPSERAVRVVRHLDAPVQAEVLRGLDAAAAGLLLNAMEPDDRVRLFDALAEAQRARFLDVLNPRERASTEALLRYPRESAGRMMSPEFVRLSAGMTVAQALDAVRAQSADAETLYFLPVVAAGDVLQGVVGLADLVLAAPEEIVGDLDTEDVPAVGVAEDQEDVARFIKTADLFAVPVVEEGGRLVGIITFDDAMEVLEFEEGEDLARTGAAEPLDRPYLGVSILKLVRSRLVWLSVLALAATLTVNVLNAFEGTLDQVVALALFIPLLIGIGGNTGAQSATTIVRALAVNDVAPRDVLKVALREAQTGFVLGAVIGVIGLVGVSILFGGAIGVIVAVTLVAICTLAALVGSVMPIIARVFKIDPAVFSAPFVTTIVDASGLLVYFLVAQAVLGL